MTPSAAAMVAPARRLTGRVRVPGDKSISHRYALLGALSTGRTKLHEYSRGADCQSTLACLQQLGVVVENRAETVVLHGRGLFSLKGSSSDLDVGNSGTTIRMLCGILAAQPFDSRMIGDASLSSRPMTRVIEPLSQMGARIEATANRAPLTIRGTTLSPIAFRQKVPSAQVKSAILLAGLHTEGTTTVTEPAATRDHTERALAAFGFELTSDGLTRSIRGGQTGHGTTLVVPGDFSSAAFWLAAAAASPGSHVVIDGVGLNPTRTAFVNVLRRFGALVEITPTGEGAGEPLGTISVTGDRTNSVTVGPDEVPLLIDELPAIATLAAYGGEVTVTGAEELRIKESDRIHVLVTGFRGLGIDADERHDGYTIRGSGPHPGGVADAHGDHRMAMAFAIAALAGTTPSRIDGADSVAVSYPGFFETLEQLAR